MALIKCPECGKEFSSNADACPNCACPSDKVKNIIYQDSVDLFERSKSIDNLIILKKNFTSLEHFKDSDKKLKEIDALIKQYSKSTKKYKVALYILIVVGVAFLVLIWIIHYIHVQNNPNKIIAGTYTPTGADLVYPNREGNYSLSIAEDGYLVIAFSKYEGADSSYNRIYSGDKASADYTFEINNNGEKFIYFKTSTNYMCKYDDTEESITCNNNIFQYLKGSEKEYTKLYKVKPHK